MQDEGDAAVSVLNLRAVCHASGACAVYIMTCRFSIK